MMRPIVNPGQVTWAGDHLLLYLRPTDADEDTTIISYYRKQARKLPLSSVG